MAGLRDTLNRFRPAAAPGAPGRRGMPVDRSAERESELAPLFAALTETEHRAGEIRRHAADEAERMRRDARRRADGVLAEARVRAEALRSDAAARATASAEQERERARRAALDVAERRGHTAAEQLPGLVDRAVALALGELGVTTAGQP